MSVHFISGKPGGGKTLYALKLIIEELLYGTRPIYTNVPIHAGRLSEYLQQKYPNKTVDLLARLVILDDETQTPKFWTVRPGNPSIPVLTAGDWSAGRKPVYGEIQDHGVFYAIDEIHNFFNARAWQETGRDVLFYLSQHRKLGDTVICITQAIGNVDKQFRSVTQDFTYLRNLNKERMGLFRLPSVFVRRTYGSPATDNAEAMESGTFTLDVSGIASCYNTAQGVSIHGKGADLKEKKTGLNIWVFIIGLPALIALVTFGAPKLIAKYFSADKNVAQINEENKRKIQGKPAEAAKPEVATWQQAKPQGLTQTSSQNEIVKTNTVPEPKVVMVDRLFGPWKVRLDNGMEYHIDNGLEEITKTHVVILGRLYRYAHPLPGQFPQPQAAPVAVYNPPYQDQDKPAVEVIIFGKRTEPDKVQLPQFTGSRAFAR